MAPALCLDYTGEKSNTYQVSCIMGKAREITKGQLASGVLDYRHPVGTVEESEGFGSSGQVDTEMTISENSSLSKRKRGSLNSDTCEKFSIPVEVISLSKMSKYERKSLKMRLKEELENIQSLKMRFASLSSYVSVSSPHSGIRNFNDGKKRLPGEQGNKRFKSGDITPLSGKGVSEHIVGSVGQVASSRASKAVLMKECGMLLDKLISHQFGWVFKKPVDVVELNIPDYFTVIERPMDFGTIKNNILSGSYSSPQNFAEDVRLTFSNAMTYNPPGNHVHMMADKLSKVFEMRWKYKEKKLSMVTDAMPIPPKAAVNAETRPARPTKKRQATSLDRKDEMEPVKRAMTMEEKQILGTELEALLEELPGRIIDFLKQQSVTEGQCSEDEIEIEIDALSNDALFTLRKLLDEYLSEKQKKKEKVEHCEIELPNEPGLSNSSAAQCKDSGNDPAADVDGVTDHFVSGRLPEVKDKDTAFRESKKSSSSKSGSSSRDYVSGRSPGSEPDGPKSSTSPRASKKITDVREQRDRMQNGTVDKWEKNVSKSLEEGEGGGDGESAPSERQVSPEKLYRAAMLRGRFADTILRAREKTLEDYKLDPEKLRLKREELERQQREERARLEAEAMAAEEARRKAEEDAAAEIRRKREAEREAARQALQKMEKTVEINECSQFIEDLEMFGGGESQELQKLGLFMKDESDGEEEGPTGQIE